eukprot:UN27184
MNMFIKSAENFWKSLKKKVFNSKHKVLSEYSNLILSLIFQHLNFCTFPDI